MLAQLDAVHSDLYIYIYLYVYIVTYVCMRSFVFVLYPRIEFDENQNSLKESQITEVYSFLDLVFYIYLFTYLFV